MYAGEMKAQMPSVNKSLVFLFLLLSTAGVLAYDYREMQRQNADLSREIFRLQTEQWEQSAEQQAASERLGAALLQLAENLDIAKGEQDALRSSLQGEQLKAQALAAQLGQVSGTVQTLEKLKNTDEELLQKYSKVYFLNEHYIPVRLLRIEPAYVFDVKTPKKELQIHASVWPYLKNMMDAADKAVGEDILIISAFRSFGTQETLKSHYVVTYGAGTANQFSADQGYSEHQLGTTVDFTTINTGTDFDAFEKTNSYVWLTKNAHKYGFTLSYPKSNTYYKYEPWHWRFVGVALATRLYNDGKHFYDFEQREIDKYLVSVFD